MPSLVVTRHAIKRYRERVARLTDLEIGARLTNPTFKLAAQIGAPFVKLSCGARAVIREQTVVTILPSDIDEYRLHQRFTDRHLREEPYAQG